MGGQNPPDVKHGGEQMMDDGVLVIGLVFGVAVHDHPHPAAGRHLVPQSFENIFPLHPSGSFRHKDVYNHTVFHTFFQTRRWFSPFSQKYSRYFMQNAPGIKDRPTPEGKKKDAYPAFIGALLDEGVKKTCRWQVFSPRVPARRTGAHGAKGEAAPKGEVQQKSRTFAPPLLVHF